jgi:hypothetical protein
VTRLRALAVGIALLLGGSWPVAGAPGVACAADQPRAVLVVDTGARVLTYCVTLDGPEVSGLRLIELAGAQHGLPYRLGFGGQAVCRLSGVGPSGDDCFAQYPEYWGYWHGDGNGGWTWASAGAGSYRVGDGDVEAWVWGTGDSAATHRQPPRTTFAGACPASTPTTPPPSPSRPATASPTKSAAPTQPRATTDHGSTTTPTVDPSPSAPASPSRERERTKTETTSAAAAPSAVESPSPPSEVELAAAETPTDAGGPSGAALAGAGLAAALAIGDWFRLRSRRTR